MENSGGDDDQSTAPVAILAFPASGTPPGIPGFDLLIITSSMFGAIAIYVFYKKRRDYNIQPFFFIFKF